MKKRSLTLLLSLLLLLPLTVICRAESEYNDSLWRLNDYVGVMDDEEAEAFDEQLFDALERYEFDLPICLRDDFEDQDLVEYGQWFYEHNGFGYGAERDGVLLVADLYDDEAVVMPFGPRGEALLTENDCADLAGWFEDEALEDCAQALENYAARVCTVLSSAETAERDVLDPAEQPGTQLQTDMLTPKPSELPAWYPEDVAHFQNFQDPDAPRLVDEAGIFSEDTRQAIRAKLESLRECYGKDFVVYTDVSSYGLDRSICAADFYVFNGYGLGSDASGLVLFICMEPGNRGWWTAATGSSRSYITERNINRLDDRLEPYMKAGDYGEGVLGYLDDLDVLFKTGSAPRPASETALLTALSLAGGAVAAIAVVASLRAQMKTVAQKAEADEYLAPGSFVLRNRRNYFLRSSISRRRIEKSSGGGGGSSFSGGYSSSSGSSFSGGGRSF